MPQPSIRCPWAATELSIAYHDAEWGVPAHDENTLFEFLILEGAQAGLSWETILKKRDRYREVYEGFDPARVARFDDRWKARVLTDPGIVRNRLKIESSLRNARAFLAVQEAEGSFDAFVWRFVGGTPIQSRRASHSDIPATTPESDAMSRGLKSRGFNFVGSTICYAFMQAVGMANDHLLSCPRQRHIRSLAGRHGA